MPALFPLRLALTKEQDEWLKRRGRSLGKTGPEIVSALIDAEMGGENTAARIAELAQMFSESEARRRRLETELTSHHVTVSTFLKEMFRESSANLYRIESVIDTFPEPIATRQQLNEYVRNREREMNEKLRLIHGGKDDE